MSGQQTAHAKPNTYGTGIVARTGQGYLHIHWDQIRHLADQMHDLMDTHEQENNE